MTTEYGIRIGKDGDVFRVRDLRQATRIAAVGGEHPLDGLFIVSRTVTDWAEIEPPDDSPRCRWCGEPIGIIHYGDGDRWQPTPALGDDLCEIRAELATADGIYRHEPEDR